MKSKQLDVTTSLRSFFDLKDWQNRTLFFGGIYFLILLVLFVSQIIFIIPFLGWILGCFLLIGMMLASMAFGLYFEGYKLDIVRAVSQGKSMESVVYNSDYQRRIINGLKVTVATFIYLLPVVIIMSLSLAPLMFGSFVFGVSDAPCAGSNVPCAGDGTNSAAVLLAVLSSLFFYLAIFGMIIYQFVFRYTIQPGMLILFNREGKFSAMFRLREIMHFCRKNWVNLLLYLAITLIVGFIAGTLQIIAFFSLFICIGIVLLPIVLAVQITYQQHLDGFVIGEIDRLDRESKK